MSVLSIGDTVLWRGGFGSAPMEYAVIEGIDECERRRDKYGTPVTEIPWAYIEYACVSLDNGHWAYGEQLTRVLAAAPSGDIAGAEDTTGVFTDAEGGL